MTDTSDHTRLCEARELLAAEFDAIGTPAAQIIALDIRENRGASAVVKTAIRAIEKAIETIRRETLEEAARVADEADDQNDDTAMGRRRNETAREIAANIRALSNA